MKKIYSVAGALAVSTGSFAAAPGPTGLMCELLEIPERTHIADARPEFGWVVHSPESGDVQTAYQIVVLDADRGEVWNSGKVDSACSINVEYGGEDLRPDTSYTWKVKTWTRLAGESEWSAPQAFRTADILPDYAVSRYPLVETPVVPAKIEQKGAGHYFIDFGRVAFGYLVLEFDSPGESELEVHLGERGTAEGVNRAPGGTVRYAEVKTPVKAGSHRYRVQTPEDTRNTKGAAIQLPEEIGIIMPFRYVEIMNCPVTLTSSMVTQMAVHYPFNEEAASFSSSDEILNQIWELCRYSMKATSFCGVYVDGDRERIPYEADAYINQLSHYAVDREYSLARYSHEYLLAHPTWPTEWKQHSIMMAWADYMYTGNTESLASCYEVLKAEKLLSFRARPDGLLATRKNPWPQRNWRDIVDWPKGERDGYDLRDVNTVVNAFHYENLKQMALFSEALGRDGEAETYLEKARAFKRVFNEKLFDTERGVYVDGEGSAHASLHANMMPLAFGLVPEEHMHSVADFVVSRGMACSVYGAQYLMEGLYLSGRAEEAYALLTSRDVRSWYNMIRVGSTITLEAWDDQYKPNQDWNHAWGAVPGNIIPRYLIGVRPLEPGFGRVLIRPMPGPLERVDTTIPTIRGPIEVSIEHAADELFRLTCDLPVNVIARIEVRLGGEGAEITLDGQAVAYTEVGGFAVIEKVGSGRHEIILAH